MWRLKVAVWLLEQLLSRQATELARLRIADDVKMALQPLQRSMNKVEKDKAKGVETAL